MSQVNEPQTKEESNQKVTGNLPPTDTQIDQRESENIAVANDVSKSVGVLQLLGVSPAAALLLIIVDMMLFAVTAGTAGVGWLVSIPVSLVLGFIVAIFQQRNFGDDWLLASAKGAMCGLLTVIPTPLPSFVTAGAGVLGGIHKLTSRKNKTAVYQGAADNEKFGVDLLGESQIKTAPPAQSFSKQSWIIIALLFAIATALIVRLFI